MDYIIMIALAVVIGIQIKRIQKLNIELAEVKRSALRKAVHERIKEEDYDDVFRGDEQTGQESRKEWGTISSSTIDGGMCRSNSSRIKVSKKQDKRKLCSHTRGTSRCNKSEDATPTSI